MNSLDFSDLESLENMYGELPSIGGLVAISKVIEKHLAGDRHTLSRHISFNNYLSVLSHAGGIHSDGVPDRPEVCPCNQCTQSAICIERMTRAAERRRKEKSEKRDSNWQTTRRIIQTKEVSNGGVC